MSCKHLRIYTIIFEDDELDLEPLVYAEDLSRNGVHWNGSLMGTKNDAFLLSDGDRLRLTRQTSVFFKAATSTKPSYFDLAQEREMQGFRNQYVVTDRLLGSGAFGRVFMAIDQTTRTQLACKMVDLRRVGDKQRCSTRIELGEEGPTPTSTIDAKQVRIWADKQKRQAHLERIFDAYLREFEILALLSHPNIVGLDKVFVTDNTLYVFQELVTAGDLFSYIESKNCNLLEVEAAVIIRQVLIAVEYLHGQDIAHRDIKPENIMLSSPVTGARVILTDFGSARRILPPRRAMTLAGTEEYGAPEMLQQRSIFFTKTKQNKGYSLAVDMWSIGTVSALLLCGFRAFDSPSGDHDPRAALRGDLSRLESSPKWRRLDERPKNFVRRLLELRENHRLDAKGALKHPWFSNNHHKLSYEDLYQRMTKSWRPRLPSLPTIEFSRGLCHEVKYFDSSQKVLGEQRQSGSRRSQYKPIEPPYKPFYRKLYDQNGLWPARKRTYGMTEEQGEAIEQWNRAFSGAADASSCTGTSPTVERAKLGLPRSRTRKEGVAKTAKDRSIRKASAVAVQHISQSAQVHANAPGSSPVRDMALPRSDGLLLSTKPTTSSLPMRPILDRSQAFHVSNTVVGATVVSTTNASGLIGSRKTGKTPCSASEDNHSEDETDFLTKPDSNVLPQPVSRAHWLTTEQGSLIPIKRIYKSIYDLDVEDTTKGDAPQSPHEAKNSIMQETWEDLVVSPHGMHLRLSSEL